MWDARWVTPLCNATDAVSAVAPHRHQTLCYAQMLGTHNSAITLADGYGNRDDIYTSYLSWIGTLVCVQRVGAV